MDASPEVLSPVTGQDRVRLESVLRTDAIIQGYRRRFSVDVSESFEGLDEVAVYQCLDTAYRFYFPFRVQGTASFYEALISSTSAPYYMGWRWEHERCLSLVGEGDTVLEIGCGQGIFLDALRRAGAEPAGLEITPSSAAACRANGHTVFEEPIAEYASHVGLRYDAVCAFQTLEHVHSVREFLDAAIALVRPGGKLLLSVPNMDSFLSRDHGNWLNMPPHHMGLWNEDALRRLVDHFPLASVVLHLEPLQRYHIGPWYRAVMGAWFRHLPTPLDRLLRVSLFAPVCLCMLLGRRFVKGFTVVAEYSTAESPSPRTVARSG